MRSSATENIARLEPILGKFTEVCIQLLERYHTHKLLGKHKEIIAGLC